MKTLTVCLNFESQHEMRRQLKKIESMIKLGLTSSKGEKINFTLDDETESRTEIVKGVKCTVLQSKMNHKKSKL